MSGRLVDLDQLQEGSFPVTAYATGDKVFGVGETGECLYIVKSGSVQITMFGTVLETIKPEGLFGEMALIDGQPRSATAIAGEDTQVAKVDKDTFRALVRKNPDFALDVMEIMAKRLRQMNDSV